MENKPEDAQWDGHERRTHHWHLKKEITIGQIITLGTVVMGFIGYAVQNETRHQKSELRLDVQQKAVEKLEEADRNLSAKQDATIVRIEGLIQRVDDKLNRLIEKGK